MAALSVRGESVYVCVVCVRASVCLNASHENEKCLHFYSFNNDKGTGNIVKHSIQSNRLTCVRIHMHNLQKAKGLRRLRL